MGRDMFVRTVAGLSLSIRIGLLTAAVSAVMAFVLGLSAAVFGKFVDSAVRLLIDIVMGIPICCFLILDLLCLRAWILGALSAESRLPTGHPWRD